MILRRIFSRLALQSESEGNSYPIGAASFSGSNLSLNCIAGNDMKRSPIAVKRQAELFCEELAFQIDSARGRRALDGRLSAPSGTGNRQQPPPPLLSSPPRPTDPISNLKLPSSSSISVQRSAERAFSPFCAAAPPSPPPLGGRF